MRKLILLDQFLGCFGFVTKDGNPWNNQSVLCWGEVSEIFGIADIPNKLKVTISDKWEVGTKPFHFKWRGYAGKNRIWKWQHIGRELKEFEPLLIGACACLDDIFGDCGKTILSGKILLWIKIESC